MAHKSDKEAQFVAITDSNKDVIAKVCYLYASPQAPFEDLYQEVLVNLWQGLDSFRGDAKLSTWIYRTAINTCISWHRRNLRHSSATTLRIDDVALDPVDSTPSGTRMADYRELQRLISMLSPVDKALISLWLDEKPYDEISAIIGISSRNVAVSIHRIKEKLSKLANS